MNVVTRNIIKIYLKRGLSHAILNTKDGWIICDLMSFSAVISGGWEGDNEGCAQWNPVYDRTDFLLQPVSNSGSLDQQE